MTSTLTRTPGGQRTRIRAGVVAAAALAALAVWAVAVPLLGVELYVPAQGRAVGPVAVVLSGLVAGLAGWALLAVLERRTPRAAAIWTWTAVAVAALSLGGPLTAGAGAATTTVLVLLHLTVAAVLVAGLPRAAR